MNRSISLTLLAALLLPGLLSAQDAVPEEARKAAEVINEASLRGPVGFLADDLLDVMGHIAGGTKGGMAVGLVESPHQGHQPRPQVGPAARTAEHMRLPVIGHGQPAAPAAPLGRRPDGSLQPAPDLGLVGRPPARQLGERAPSAYRLLRFAVPRLCPLARCRR